MGNGPRPKSPLPERTEGGVIQYRATNTLCHGSSGDAAAPWINRHDANPAPGDFTRTRLVGILGTRRVYGECFRSGHCHRLGFDWREFLLRRRRWPWWRCPFFDKLRLNLWRRRGLGEGNIFRRWSGLRWRQCRLNDGWCIRRKLYRRRLVPLSKRNRGQVNCHCTTHSCPQLPLWGWAVK